MTSLLISLLVFAVIAVVVTKNVFPYSRIEVGLLHVMYRAGSGFDDGAADIIISNQQRYSPQIVRMLSGARPGSSSEEIALDFVEYVIDQPGVGEALKEMGNIHPNPDTRKLIAAILDGPQRTITVLDGDGATVDMVVPNERNE